LVRDQVANGTRDFEAGVHSGTEEDSRDAAGVSNFSSIVINSEFFLRLTWHMRRVSNETAAIGLLVSTKAEDRRHAVTDPANVNLFLCLNNKSSRGSWKQDVKLHLIFSSYADSFFKVLITNDATRIILAFIKILIELLIKEFSLALSLILLFSNDLFHLIF
jgi:hypothetical protein